MTNTNAPTEKAAGVHGRSADGTERSDSSEPPQSSEPSSTKPSGHAHKASDEPGAQTLTIDLIDTTRTLKAAASEWLHEYSLKACARAGIVGGSLRVKFVHDEAMADAHKKHCGVGGTTDVITFNLNEDGATTLNADLLVCIDEAARHAEGRRLSVKRELLLYILHGVLHCLGQDDTDDKSYAKMHELEDEILEDIGVGAAFRGYGGGGA